MGWSAQHEPSSSLFTAVQVTAINLGGYLLAFLGVCYYNYQKLQNMKARQAAASSSAAAAKQEEQMPLVKGGKSPA